MARTVYLTCELKSRDLDSRLLLAAHLLKSGHDVVVGQQWSMFQNAATCPKGLFLFKTANRIQTHNMRYARAHGHMVVAMDEEVLAVTDPSVVRLSTDPEVFDLAHAFLFQNEEHRAMFGREGAIVGNVRVDLLRSLRAFYEPEAAQCSAAGPYVLVNTNYAMSNSVWGSAEAVRNIALNASRPDLSVPGVREYLQAWPAGEQRNFDAMIGYLQLLVPRLGKVRLVLRPHPAENQGTWRGVERAEILAGTNPVPWIMGAALTVHTNSTTGLEAALLGCPCLNLNPDPSSAFSRSFVMNDSPFQAATPEEAFAATRRALSGEAVPNDMNWLPVFPENAAARVAAEIATRAIDSPPVAGWVKTPRNSVEVEKFAATFEEVSGRLWRICALLGIPKLAGGVLDDSLFWFGRTSTPAA